ncbi:MAG: 2-C-methyl-D-erythritol 2,4-cyclodiphosphate synthase [Burkholderiales bacterium]
MTMRIGTGFDVHALVAGRPLVVGGVTIPHPTGLAGHSDADVLLHAIADALLGALAMGDLGAHFPDTDPKWKGADSRALLRHVKSLADARGYDVGNVDATIVAQAPKMAPHVAAMRENVAADLGCDVGRVSIKATTTERLGFAGREEGIAAQAVVLLALREEPVR